MCLLQAYAPSDSDDEDEFVYNPLKLPLGYDGKPIPYWLYKLHGLNQVMQQSSSRDLMGILPAVFHEKSACPWRGMRL